MKRRYYEERGKKKKGSGGVSRWKEKRKKGGAREGQLVMMSGKAGRGRRELQAAILRKDNGLLSGFRWIRKSQNENKYTMYLPMIRATF